MRYSTVLSGKRRIDAVVVSHNDETIEFKGTQTLCGGDADQELFEFMNIFFEGCRDSTLDQLWGLFKEGKRILQPGYFEEVESVELSELRERSLDYQFLCEKLGPIIKKMYELITPNEIAYAAQVTGRTIAPKDLMRMAAMGDYPEETTIDNDKYAELVKLAFTAQLCFPLVNQLLDQIFEVTGKEYQYAVVGGMISQIPSIVEIPGWKIMDTYIRASCARKDSKRENTDVVSEERYVDYIVFEGLFNKLALSFIPSKLKDKNLSKELNSLVEGKVRKEQSTKFTRFSESKPGSDDQSIPESYRISQTVNGSDEEAMAEFFSFGMFDEEDKPRYKDIFKYQAKALGIKGEKLVEKLYNNLPTVWDFRFTNIQNQLLQLAFIDDINYYLYPAMDYRQLTAAMCLAQVKLFEQGYEHLAQLVCAMRSTTVPITYMGDEFKLSTKEREDLVNLCYIYVGQSVSTTDNMLVMSVQSFLDELAASGWESNIEPGLLGNQTFIDAMSPGDMYPIDLVPEIKRELLALITQTHSVEKENEE